MSRVTVSLATTLALMAWVVGIIVASLGLRAEARIFPLVVAIPTLVLLGLVVVGEFNQKLAAAFEMTWEGAELEDEGAEAGEEARPERKLTLADIPWKLVGTVFGGLLLFAIGVVLIGFTIAAPLFVLLFLRLYGGAGWIGSGVLAAGTTAGMLGLAHLLKADLYRGVLSGAPLPPF